VNTSQLFVANWKFARLVETSTAVGRGLMVIVLVPRMSPSWLFGATVGVAHIRHVIDIHARQVRAGLLVGTTVRTSIKVAGPEGPVLV